MFRAALTSAGQFEISEADKPEAGPDQVLLRVKSVGICGSDLHLFREGMIGGIPLESAGRAFVPGHECSGVVESAGEGVDAAMIGKLVAVDPSMPCGHCRLCRKGAANLCPNVEFLGSPPVDGVLQEYRVVPAGNVLVLPESMDADSGMMLEPLGVAVHALEIGRVKPGRSAVVLGSGCIGLCSIMLLSRMGISPIVATDILDYRLEAAARLGATHTFNPERDDVPAAVSELTGGEGADYTLECAGDIQTQRQMIECAAIGGKALVLGVPEGRDELAFSHSCARRKGLGILMIRRCNVELGRVLRRAVEGELPLASMVTHHYEIREAQRAFEAVAAYRDGVVKAAIVP